MNTGSDDHPHLHLPPALLVCAEEVIHGTSVLRRRETWGIDHAHMALDGVDYACRMRQRAHMTGVGNLAMAGTR